MADLLLAWMESALNGTGLSQFSLKIYRRKAHKTDLLFQPNHAHEDTASFSIFPEEYPLDFLRWGCNRFACGEKARTIQRSIEIFGFFPSEATLYRAIFTNFCKR
ncbi:MAG: hypothetical protein QM680_02510 [Luteolibacter sp.]